MEAWEGSPRVRKDCLILGSAHARGLKRRRIFVLSPQIPYCVLLDMISGHRCFGKAGGEAICATRDIIRATQVAEQSLMHVIMIEFSRSVCRCCGVSDVSKV